MRFIFGRKLNLKFYLEMRYPLGTSNGMQWRVRYENTILPEGDAVHFSENL
jgi:hypothetical protein